jgi:hypothetical protein
MANYYENARTNYFKVKDEAKFNEFLCSLSGLDSYKDKEGRHAIFFDYESGVPSSRFNEKTKDYDEVDFLGELSNHLTDDSVAIVMGAGAEKLRYINGYAEAINSKGERVGINISDIYDLAKQKFGKDAEVTPAQY